MASEDYTKAQKLARSAYRSAVSKGDYPYLPALDEILQQVNVKTEQPLGLVTIQLDQIVGTKTAGRQNAFAGNFMPLMPEKSEFAHKWDNVLSYHMDQGIGDPIVAYEFMNRFYVLEGNKRVSVLKYVHADSIEGSVTRVIPYPEDTLENKIYYEFLDFYKDSQINYIWFSQTGSFPKLSAALGKKSGEKWTEEELVNFKSLYNHFTELFVAKGGQNLKATPGDALLFYLSLYPYEDILQKTPAEMKADVDKIWEEFPLIGHDTTDKAVVLEPAQEQGGSIFTRFFSQTSSKQLKIAFIHDQKMDQSGWTYSHELGRMALDQMFGDRIRTEAFFLQDESTDILELLNQVIAAGNHLIFTTSQKFLAASLKAAIEHPEARILNCSVGQPYSAIRTYYGRLYEAKFLAGMIAGAMSDNDKIAYIARYPIYGAVANINAFALGARMTNPRARVYLYWNSLLDREPFADLIRREGISVISDNDMIRPSSEERLFGLYMTRDGNLLKLAAPIWNWGRFYERIIRDFLQGNWDRSKDVRSKPAVNYWWGIASGILDLITSQNLPHGVDRLTQIMKQQIYTDEFNPFAGEITIQGGLTKGEKGKILTPEEIITQDYLVRSVVGFIPSAEQLEPEARELLSMQANLTPAATKIES
jgi:basic membrane lipoprotein Med (substrate-binding protein (PBP1-ABC) superfamily)